MSNKPPQFKRLAFEVAVAMQTVGNQYRLAQSRGAVAPASTSSSPAGAKVKQL